MSKPGASLKKLSLPNKSGKEPIKLETYTKAGSSLKKFGKGK